MNSQTPFAWFYNIKFNWDAFLKKSVHTEKELSRACDLASSWTSCAVGFQPAAIIRNSKGEPYDYLLKKMGSAFRDYILESKHGEAKEIYAMIKERVRELMKAR